MKTKKLQLNKEVIAQLGRQEMYRQRGGRVTQTCILCVSEHICYMTDEVQCDYTLGDSPACELSLNAQIGCEYTDMENCTHSAGFGCGGNGGTTGLSCPDACATDGFICK